MKMIIKKDTEAIEHWKKLLPHYKQLGEIFVTQSKYGFFHVFEADEDGANNFLFCQFLLLCNCLLLGWSLADSKSSPSSKWVKSILIT